MKASTRAIFPGFYSADQSDGTYFVADVEAETPS
jgi:hypothetical protein